MILSLLFLSVIVVINAQIPVPPPAFPANWYTWVVTSVVKSGVSKPQYDYGQLIGYNVQNQWSCRLNQQDLLTPKPTRPVDFCDFQAEQHYFLPSNAPNAVCGSTTPIVGNLSVVTYPAEYLAAAKFFGVDKVNQLMCNHFVASSIIINGVTYQMDVWTDQNTNLPCQISATDLGAQVVTNWAFDGFGTVFPNDSVNQCLAAKIMCAQSNWVCNVVPGTPDSSIIAALSWVCGSGGLNCAPINPGGDHYIPNTPVDHGNWAFNQYYLQYRTVQGPNACAFGGIAHIIPPPPSTYQADNDEEIEKNPGIEGLFAMFSNNLTCD